MLLYFYLTEKLDNKTHAILTILKVRVIKTSFPNWVVGTESLKEKNYDKEKDPSYRDRQMCGVSIKISSG